jgi:galactokinase
MSPAAADFVRQFGRSPALVADAPGRVNLIGEHTDYNGGLVLPLAIPQRTYVALAPRRDDRVRVVTAAPAITADDRRADYALGDERRTGRWTDYVQGCTAALAARGHRVGGFDAVITSEVPVGAGLSSSAALEVALLRGLRAAFGLALDDVALALLAHGAEYEFVGARVGIMDQMAASLADEGTALFLDARSLAYERVRLPATVELAVIDSGVPHRHADGGYNARRAECERAAELLEVASLRDVDDAGLARAARLPPPLPRRVRHVVTENGRVLAAVEALRQGDLDRLGRLLGAAHASLRDDYEVSTPEIDLLVTRAAADPDVVGARLTGGGFGGAIVMVAARGRAAAAAARVAAAYHGPGGRVLVPRPTSGPSPARTP